MIFITFNSRNDNLGDKLIFSYLFSELQRHDEVVIFGSSPAGFKQKALRLREAVAKAFFNRIKGHKTCIFHSPGARFLPKKTMNAKLPKIIKDKIVLAVWSLLGATFHVVGISTDERYVAKRYGRFKRYKTIGVRDKESLEVLSGIVGCATLVPDMAFLRSPSMRDDFQKKVIVSLRQETPDDQYDVNYKPALESSLTSISVPFFKKEWSVSFFANVMEDRSFNNSLALEFSKSQRQVNYIENMPIDLDYSTFFQGYGVAVSNRLHVLIPAMTEGLLPVALVSRKHSKIISLFRSYGLDQFLVYTDENSDDIQSKITDLIDWQEQLRCDNYKMLCLLKSQVENYIDTVVGTSR